MPKLLPRKFTSIVSAAIFGLTLIGLAGPAQAIPIEFTYAGVDANGFTAEGSIGIDDSLFNGSAVQLISNSNFLSFSFTGNTSSGLVVFGLADVDTTAGTIFDSSAVIPQVVNGVGFLATNGLLDFLVMFGDTTVSLNALPFVSNYEGAWTFVEDAVEVPEPSTLGLFAIGLVGLGIASRRRRKQQDAA